MYITNNTIIIIVHKHTIIIFSNSVVNNGVILYENLLVLNSMSVYYKLFVIHTNNLTTDCQSDSYGFTRANIFIFSIIHSRCRVS